MRLSILLRLSIFMPFGLVGCGEPATEQPVAEKPAISVAGHIENEKLDETSGLALSQRDPGLLWAINDDGPAAVYAMGTDGSHRGAVRIRDAENIDWEDIDSFEKDGTAYLIVADIGDNESRRPFVTAYIIKEPAPTDDKVDIEWRIDFRYPDGPRDAESLAVDVAGDQVLVLSKRDMPAMLYEVPLGGSEDDVIDAEPVVNLATLRQPTPLDVANAAAAGWAWQPTAMSLSGTGALILTYERVYYYARNGNTPWDSVFATRPMALSTNPYRDAESLTFAGNGMAYMTVEGLNPPILRIDLSTAQ